MEILNQNPVMLLGLFEREEQSEENKIVGEHLKRFSNDFDKISKKIKEINSKRYSTVERLRKEIPEYVGNKLMALMLKNLSKKHEEVHKVSKEENEYHESVIVATPAGFRQRWSYGKQTDNLSLNNIIYMLSKNPDVFIDWMRNKKLYKKLEAFRELKDAFNDGFNKEWLDFKEFSREIEINKPVFFVDLYEESYSRNSDKVSIKEVVVDKIVGKVDRNNNVDLIFKTQGKIPEISWGSSFIRMFGFRDLTEEILSVLVDVEKKVVEFDGDITTWWDSFKSKLSKYSALADL